MLRADSIRPMVRHGQRFGIALALVIAGAHAHRIHVAPVSFHLRMLQRIAVAFRCRRKQETRAVASRDLKHVTRPGRAGLQSFNGMLQIFARAGRATRDATHDRTVPSIVTGWSRRIRQTKPLVTDRDARCSPRSSDQIVERNHSVAGAQQAIAKMGANESGGAGDEMTHSSLIVAVRGGVLDYSLTCPFPGSNESSSSSR